LSAELDDLLGARPLASGTGAAAVALVGDLDEATALAELERQLGEIEVAAIADGPRLSLAERSRSVELDVPVAQAQLGYVVLAPPPSDPDSWTWRMLLYVLSHGYEGRLGMEAISRRGLVYYIDSSYESDGRQARVTLRIGVDPEKLEAMRQLLVESLENLGRNPPGERELFEAKQHLLGRRQSAAQSNGEISAALLDEWIGQGRLLSAEEFTAAVGRVTRDSVLEIIPSFIAGGIVEVHGRQ
jgi:predicted Zn-dependent peptidase